MTERVPRLDALLRFSAPVEAVHEAATGAERTLWLRQSIVIGLILYNLYNLTSLFLLDDILGLSIAARVLVVTPTSLGLMWLIKRVDPVTRERLVALGIGNAFLVPVFLFWLSEAPLANFTFGELPLTLVFGNMLLLLRFRFAILFTGLALAAVALALVTKSGLDPQLRLAFGLQFATAALFSLFANWRIESLRCRAHLAEFDARSDAAMATRLSERFRDLSRTDDLTALPNRRAIEGDLGRWFREPTPITAMMVDVDHFKLYNDRLGHPAGDACLRRVGDCFARVAAGRGAVAARWGGEEFLVILRGGGEAAAAALADHLVTAVRALAIAHPARGDGTGIVTVSLGWARAPMATDETPEELLSAADAALYHAKREGRDRWANAAGLHRPQALVA